MDGTYESSLDLRIPAADTIILLEVSRWTCLWHAFKRKATVDDQHRHDAPAGEKLDLAFLRYIWRYPLVTHPFVIESIEKHGADKNLIQVEGSTETEQFLMQVQQVMEPNGASA